jgi:1,4-alpha-glucan branching enzyme
MPARTSPLTSEEIATLVSGNSADPFAVLGPHPVSKAADDGWVVRVFVPRAKSATLLVDGLRVPMERRHADGFFEAAFPEAREAPSYRVAVVDSAGVESEFDDPYRHGPVLGDDDLYLHGEGTHWRLYEKLGAQVTTHEGVAGVSFAVWAPNAAQVSVVGDWNGWNPRAHPMRERGTSGVWELFLPGLRPGEMYKYFIRSRWKNHTVAKADPFGFRMELRPQTASVVCDLSRYRWNDGEWMATRAARQGLNRPMSIYEVHLGSWMRVKDGEDAAAAPPASGATAAPAAAPPASDAAAVPPAAPPAPRAAAARPATGAAVASSAASPGPLGPWPDHDENGRWLTYRELADRLLPYVAELGMTHIELLPITEHPFDGSWGYQTLGYFAPTSRFGTPDDFRYFVDRAHQAGIGVLLDWVPAHFPKDEHGLAFFDGTALYEHADPRRGEHRDWGTLVYNYGRREVSAFLVNSALFWFDRYHLDGVRVDAVASMLYLDYSRGEGEWVPNRYGGRENLEAVEFLKTFNRVVHERFPDVVTIAEESTSWPMVSRPIHLGGLGFDLKWNMGWMHDMLEYMRTDPIGRKHLHNKLTFSLFYAFSENFLLPLSHDEVVHGKGSLIGKMPGDYWKRFANLRALYAYMYAHPGKKLLFMGAEIGQWKEWNHDAEVDWVLLGFDLHAKMQAYFRELNRLYTSEGSLSEADFTWEGFQWIDFKDVNQSVVVFQRRAADPVDHLVIVANFTPVERAEYRVGVPHDVPYRELLNSDAVEFGGSGSGNPGALSPAAGEWQEQKQSITLTLPPLGVLFLKPTRRPEAVLPKVAVAAESALTLPGTPKAPAVPKAPANPEPPTPPKATAAPRSPVAPRPPANPEPPIAPRPAAAPKASAAPRPPVTTSPPAAPEPPAAPKASAAPAPASPEASAKRKPAPRRRKSTPLLGLLAGALLAAGAVGTGMALPRADEGVAAYRAALAAYESGNLEAYLTELARADSLIPGQPGLARRLAGGAARLGHLDEAAAWITRYAAYEVRFDLDSDPDLESIRSRAEYLAAKARIADLDTPVGGGTPAAELPERALLTEGIAWDEASGRFFISSVHRRKIVTVNRNREYGHFAPAEGESLFAPLAVLVDGDRRGLWVTTTAMPEMVGFDTTMDGRAELKLLDLDSGRIRGTWAVPDTGRDHNLNDVAMTGRGELYLSDARSGAIYHLESEEVSSMTIFQPRGTFQSPQGLAVSAGDAALYVADYGLGLFRIDLKTGVIDQVEYPNGASLMGIDGLIAIPGGLIAIQNGIAPHRVVRLTLDAAGRRVTRHLVLDREHPLFDEPTLGVVVGDELFYNARSQWGRIRPGGGFPPPDSLDPHLILRVRVK